MNKIKTILWSTSVGAALGAGIMYILDPDRGRRRRAKALSQGASMVRHAGRAASKMTRDVENRTRGLAAEVLQTDEPVDDDVLAGRVRARLGRLVEHSHRVDVTVRNGVVILGGVVGRDEYPKLIAEVSNVAGVKRVENRLSEPIEAQR